MKIDWKITPAVLGLTFLTISPGFSNDNAGSLLSRSGDPRKALMETTAICLGAVYVTKSWWPIVGPFAYLVYDQYYHDKHVPITEVVNGD